MITLTQGDLFTCGIPVIAHGCNCRGVMGAGIAVQFRQRWPQMYEEYRKRCARPGGFIPGDVMAWQYPGGVIFNLATQRDPGPCAHPWMITAAVGRMIAEASYEHRIRQVALPAIGCGIGGLGLDHLMAALSPYKDAPVNLTVIGYAGP